MPGTFFGLNIGATGLVAAQIGQDVTGNNIANAGTAGYSVESASQVASDPYTLIDHVTLPIPGALGTGVSVNRIQRASDQFLDTQVRDATSSSNFQTSQSSTLKQVDDAFGEPSDTGLNATIGKFFSSFQDLANNPEDLGVRATTIQAGNALTGVFQEVGQRLTSIASTVSSNINTDVQSINDYGAQIAALNITIKQQTVQGAQPNTLLDRRGLLLDKLSALTNISVQNNPDSTVGVQIGGSPLVLGTDAYPVTVAGLTAQGDLQGGELAGLNQAQSDVAHYQGQLNTLASSLASQVNSVHSTGVGLDGTTTGLNFFSVQTGNEAATIAVNPTLLAHPEDLAAAAAPTPPATTGAPGDNSNATLLAGLKDNPSIQGFYQQFVSDAGGKAASALSAGDTANATLSQLTQQRESVTGVSTDAELTNMLKYQRAYQASAQFIQTSDSMIGTLITGLFPPGG